VSKGNILYCVPIVALVSASFGAKVGSSSSNAASPSPSSTAIAAAPGPQPATNAAVYADIEKSSNWGKCSSGACSGGNSTASYYVAPYQTSPALDGSSTEFAIAGGAYTDGLFMLQFGSDPNPSQYILDWNVYTDANAPNTAQALEFDFIQVSGGRKYNFGSECNYTRGTWDIWNEAAMQWIQTSVPCNKFTPNVWHHLRWSYERVGAQTHYLSLTVDNVTYPISSTYAYQPAPGTSWANGAMVFQVQQDLNASGSSFKEWVNEVTLYTW